METCEVCGCEGLPGSLVMHFIVPQDIAQQAGMPCPRAAILCTSCNGELQNWYPKKVFGMAYEPGTKQFRPWSPAEMVKEYEAAYQAFVAYKKRLHKTA